ncbi:MAG TPA: TonB-dependent receptor [Terriglobia bacterium]|nr:TonB-dependent receptor [Terriglobia bacterium]
MGVDFNRIPIQATFPINQAGIYYFPSTLGVDDPLIASAVGPWLAFQWKAAGAPPFSSAQTYGMGLPDSFAQQFGGLDRTTTTARNTTFGFFVQDSWRIRPSFTLDYGLRYDVEFSPTLAANSQLSASSQQLLGVMQGIPHDTNNWAPRAGFAWDPFKDGKTAIRGSYGLFYGHPLLAITLLSDVVD